VVCLYI